MDLTRDSILSADDLPMEKINVPEWGGSVYIRTMTGTERDSYEAQMYLDKKSSNGVDLSLVNLRAKLVARTACNKDRKRLFEDSDIAALGEKSCAALDRCYEKAEKLNKFSQEDIDNLAGESVSVQH